MKRDYSIFYALMVIILAILFAVTTVYDYYEMQKHLDKDLQFAKETAEFIIYEAEIIGYCANMSNMSNDKLLSNFLEYKASEMIEEFVKDMEDAE